MCVALRVIATAETVSKGHRFFPEFRPMTSAERAAAVEVLEISKPSLSFWAAVDPASCHAPSMPSLPSCPTSSSLQCDGCDALCCCEECCDRRLQCELVQVQGDGKNKVLLTEHGCHGPSTVQSFSIQGAASQLRNVAVDPLLHIASTPPPPTSLPFNTTQAHRSLRTMDKTLFQPPMPHQHDLTIDTRDNHPRQTITNHLPFHRDERPQPPYPTLPHHSRQVFPTTVPTIQLHPTVLLCSQPTIQRVSKLLDTTKSLTQLAGTKDMTPLQYNTWRIPTSATLDNMVWRHPTCSAPTRPGATTTTRCRAYSTTATLVDVLQPLWAFPACELAEWIDDHDSCIPKKCDGPCKCHDVYKDYRKKIKTEVRKSRWEETEMDANVVLRHAAAVTRYLDILPTKGPKFHLQDINDFDQDLTWTMNAVIRQWKRTSTDDRDYVKGRYTTKALQSMLIHLNVVRARLHVMATLAAAAQKTTHDQKLYRRSIRQWRIKICLIAEQYQGEADNQKWRLLTRSTRPFQITDQGVRGGYIYIMQGRNTTRHYIGSTTIAGDLRPKKDSPTEGRTRVFNRYLQHLTSGWNVSVNRQRPKPNCIPLYQKARSLQHGLISLVYMPWMGINQRKQSTTRSTHDHRLPPETTNVLTVRHVLTIEKALQRYMNPGFVAPWAHNQQGPISTRPVALLCPGVSAVRRRTDDHNHPRQDEPPTAGKPEPILIDTVTGQPWNRSRHPFAHYTPERLQVQEFKETWSDHDAISLLPKCNLPQDIHC